MASAEPPPEADALASPPARAASSEPAVLDGGRRSVVVSPDEVWSAQAPLVATPEELRLDARRSFFAPIIMAAAISTALLLLFMGALALLVWLRR